MTSALQCNCLRLPLAAVSATHHAANSLRWRLRLPLCGASAFCLLVPPRCVDASCCPPAHSPLPLAMPPPLVATLPCIAPLSFGWLLHFPAPQPLPLVVPPTGASALPFITPQPFVTPLLFGWLSCCPVPQPPSCRNSPWCLGLCLLLIPCL